MELVEKLCLILGVTLLMALLSFPKMESVKKLWSILGVTLLMALLTWENTYNKVKVDRLAETRVYNNTCFTPPRDDYVRHWCAGHKPFYVFPEWMMVVFTALDWFWTLFSTFIVIPHFIGSYVIL